MPQNQFILRQGFAKELEPFPHIKEFGKKKYSTIQLGSFKVVPSIGLQIMYIVEGKFEWVINKQHQVLYPGDTALVLPGQEIGGSKGYQGIGTFFWLKLQTEQNDQDGRLVFGEWSNLAKNECITIGKIFKLNNLSVLKVKEVKCLLQDMRLEILNQEIGFQTRVNYILDSLLIIIGRQSTRQASSQRDFPQTFTKLEQTLRTDLANPWSVEEMASMVGLGTTTFTEKVKSYTGFSPLNYLINIRISEATKLLKSDKQNITDIALGTGFYSSQHFSTTFKKLTGYTPREFRIKNTTYEKEL